LVNHCKEFFSCGGKEHLSKTTEDLVASTFLMINKNLLDVGGVPTLVVVVQIAFNGETVDHPDVRCQGLEARMGEETILLIDSLAVLTRDTETKPL
jgi:hypothetical protein